MVKSSKISIHEVKRNSEENNKKTNFNFIVQIYAKGRPKKIAEPISFIFNDEN